jgi:uncharacterized Zn finger protein
MTSRVYARTPPRRGGVRIDTWWGRAMMRALEEAAYDEAQLVAARALGRSGRIGGLIVGPGGVSAAVEDPQGLWTVRVTVPVLDADGQAAVREVLPPYAAEVATGQLGLELVERFEELGVELLPGSEELDASCTCGGWQAVCTHALAVLTQLVWLAESDPTLLFLLRGFEIQAGPGDSVAPTTEPEPFATPEVAIDDLDVAEEAALRARHLLSDQHDA